MINNYIEQATVQKVKKFYSTMNQAVLMAIRDNSTVDTWDVAAADQKSSNYKMMEYFKPYLRIMKDCGGENCGIIAKNYKYLNGTSWGYAYGSYSGNNYYKLLLDDGSALWMRINGTNKEPCSQDDEGRPNVCAVFWYDTNADKQPNTLGKDVFAVYLLKNSIVPVNTNNSNYECRYSKQGWNCLEYILTHGDMKYPK